MGLKAAHYVGEGLDPPGYFAQRRNNNCVSNSKTVIAFGDPEILRISDGRVKTLPYRCSTHS